MSIPAKKDQPVTLAMVLENGDTGRYPQAEIYSGASLVSTIDLSDLGKGRYEGDWVPTAVGIYSALFNVYEDASHTVELTPVQYGRAIEQIFVSQSDTDDVNEKLLRILGLVHENAFIDNAVYDASSMLLSSRIRIFDSKANAQLATDGGGETTGLIATYTMEAVYGVANRMTQYRMVRE